MIPHDEAHRFLRWHRTPEECQTWAAWFEAHAVPYELHQRKSPRARWTIYKHTYKGKRFCCEARG
jgi:hypothetical protein